MTDFAEFAPMCSFRGPDALLIHTCRHEEHRNAKQAGIVPCNEGACPITKKTTIAHIGQGSVDEPIYSERNQVSMIGNAVRAAFNSPPDRRPRIVLGYQTVRLRWMKPDGRGGLVPR